MVGVGVHIGEQFDQLLVGAVADRPQQHGYGDLALAVNLDAEDVLVRGLELQPGAAVGDQLGRVKAAATGGVFRHGEVDAGAAHQLADHHALGAIDHEGAVLGHQREVAHEDLLILDLAGLLDAEADADAERGGIGHVALAALELVVAGLAKLVILEVKLHALAGEILDWGDFIKQRAETGIQKLLKRLGLNINQFGHRQHGRDAGVTAAASIGGCSFGEAGAFSIGEAL